MKIIIIEDEKAHTELMERSIRKEFPDAQIDCFGDIENCLNSLGRTNPDIIITDYLLPGRDGLDLLKELQKRDKDIPVVVVTGQGNDRVAVQAMKLGAYDYIVKSRGFFKLVPSIIQKVVYKKELKRALCESQALYERERNKLNSVLASMVTPLVVIKSDMTIDFANPFFESVFGKELIGKPCRTIFPPSTDAGVRCLEAIKDRQTENLEFKDVMGRIWQVTTSPALQSEGDGLKAVLVFQDITDRKRTEEALQVSEEKYRTLFERSRDAIYITTRDGQFIEFNQSALDLFDYSKGEMMGLDVRKIYVNLAERDRFQQEIEREGFVRDHELRLFKKDGAEMDCLVTATMRRDDGGNILGYEGIIRDITERKRAEEELRESEEKYRSLAATEDSIYLLDRNCQYLFMNERHLTRLGQPDVIGRAYGELHSEEETQKIAKKVEAVFETNQSVQDEHRSGRDGRYFFRTLSPVKKKGRTIAVTVVSKDITEVKQAQEELLKAHQELKATTAQLVHTARISALGELTAAVAHELNQPLNNIKIVCQSLLRDLDKDRFSINMLPRDLKDVVGEINKMAEIIGHMRVYTRRCESLRHDEINVNEPVKGIFVLMDSQLRAHSIEVVKDLAPDLPRISGDPVGLEQVFTNLMVNAQAAVEGFREKGRRIEIRSFRKSEKEVAVSIKDNGGGVSPDIRDRLFEPFFTTKIQGTGLGLAIAKKIIDEHKGRIELEVEEGEGCTITVVLPTASQKGGN